MPASTVQALHAHPSQTWALGISVWVDVHPSPSSWELTCTVAADHGGDLVLPAAQPAGPADGLWQHSCFEAFVSAASSTQAGADSREAYSEFNWSPSGQWAHYRFASERVRTEPTGVAGTAGHLQFEAHAEHWWWRVLLPVNALPADQGHGWHLGLSAVLEHRDGRRSHWALSHPCPQPDFHHPAGRCWRIPNH